MKSSTRRWPIVPTISVLTPYSPRNPNDIHIFNASHISVSECGGEKGEEEVG
jgi:hypothetical protein